PASEELIRAADTQIQQCSGRFLGEGASLAPPPDWTGFQTGLAFRLGRFSGWPRGQLSTLWVVRRPEWVPSATKVPDPVVVITTSPSTCPPEVVVLPVWYTSAAAAFHRVTTSGAGWP